MTRADEFVSTTGVLAGVNYVALYCQVRPVFWLETSDMVPTESLRERFANVEGTAACNVDSYEVLRVGSM